MLKLGREMLVICAQLWLAAAEIAGAAVLLVWERLALPLLRELLALARVAYRFGLRHLTPARAVAVVCLVALAALAASQWIDYRGVSIGTHAYSGGLEAVAPAPEVDRRRAGNAHAWVMVPLALPGVVALGFALGGRPRAALWLTVVGVAAIAIALAVDVSKGLDEGNAAIAYEGAQARLLEGFWLQIAAGAVLVVTGALLARYLRADGAGATATAPRRGPGDRRGMLADARARLGGASSRAHTDAERPGRVEGASP